MKILHVIISCDARTGGPIQGVVTSSEVWYRYGHERNILCLNSPDEPFVATMPVTTFAIGFGGPVYRFLSRVFPLLRYSYTPKLTRWLRRHAQEYDAVVINGLWNYTSYGSWRALHKLSVPYFVFTHGMLDPWFNKAYPVKTFFKTIFWKLFEHKVLRDSNGVFFTCEEERQLAARSFAPYVAEEYVVGYGTSDIEGDPDVQRAAFAARVPGVEGREFILFLGRIHPKKGLDLLIKAFAQHAKAFPKIDLVIAGPDQVGLQKSLEELTAQLNIQHRVFWAGMLAGDAKWGAYRSAKFFALSSHQENFGLVVSEALALATPVLITNKVNIWREIEAEGAGIVSNDDLESVSHALQRMCAMSVEERDAMAERSRACFLTHYNLERNAIDLLTLIQWLSHGKVSA